MTVWDAPTVLISSERRNYPPGGDLSTVFNIKMQSRPTLTASSSLLGEEANILSIEANSVQKTLASTFLKSLCMV